MNRIDLRKVGFVTNDEGTMGCSPDRLTSDGGMLEMKNPSAHVHMKYVLDNSELVKEYNTQIQGQLLVTGMQWVDLMSYFPELPVVIVRVTRNEPYLMAMAKQLTEFGALLSAKKRKLTELGHLENAA